MPITIIKELEDKKSIMRKIQLCYIDTYYYDNYNDYILNEFDFDFCANYWNGKDIFIKNFESIKNKKCDKIEIN